MYSNLTDLSLSEHPRWNHVRHSWPNCRSLQFGPRHLRVTWWTLTRSFRTQSRASPCRLPSTKSGSPRCCTPNAWLYRNPREACPTNTLTTVLFTNLPSIVTQNVRENIIESLVVGRKLSLQVTSRWNLSAQWLATTSPAAYSECQRLVFGTRDKRRGWWW